MDVLVLRAFDRAVGGVTALAEILHKTRVNAEHGVLVALRLDDVADGQRPDITAVFKISRVQRFQAHFVEHLAVLGPPGKNPGGRDWGRVADVFVLVVFLGSPDDSILHHVLDDLGDLRLGKGNVDNQTHSVLDCVLFSGGKRQRGQEEGQNKADFPQHRSGSLPARRTGFGRTF